MEQVKHTPGPWVATGTVIKNSLGESIASGGNNRAVVGDKLAASLRLAAAAPDLLDALVALVEITEGMAWKYDARSALNFCDNARHAIAKALGVQANAALSRHGPTTPEQAE